MGEGGVMRRTTYISVQARQLAAALLPVAVACIASALPQPSLAAQAAPLPPIVSAEWLATQSARPGVVVLHIGSDSSYRAAHVPGALRLDFERVVIAPTTPGALRMELPPIATLEAGLRALGVNDDSRIVLVFDAPQRMLLAGRTFFTLEWAGLRGRVTVLDGGLPAWRASATRSVASGPGRRVVEGDVRLTPDASRVVSRERVEASIADGAVQLVDARTEQFFTPPELGGGPNGGHIESAVSLPFTSVTDGAGRFKPREEIERLLIATGVIPGEATVTYCHIGLQASWVYLALRYIGRDVALYDGSMDEWSRTARAP
jgi:thiosulfate/3-mercaptopyruvate sulfurtransferase